MKMLRVEVSSPDETIYTHGGETEALTRSGHRLARGWGILPGDGASRARGFGELLLPMATTDQAPPQPPAPLAVPRRVDEVGSFPENGYDVYK